MIGMFRHVCRETAKVLEMEVVLDLQSLRVIQYYANLETIAQLKFV